MPDSEHPVTVGDLRVADGPVDDESLVGWSTRPATVADLVSALRAEGYLVIEKVDGEWPERVTNAMLSVFMQVAVSGAHIHPSDALDVLAEAQPFPPAGELPKDPWDYDP